MIEDAMDLLGRMSLLLNEKWGGKKGGMSVGCGLTRAHIGILMTRLKKNPDASIETDTLNKIATGSKVRVAWLISGDGPMNLTDKPPPPERTLEYDKQIYTNLVPVLASLRANGELPGVLAGLEAERLAPDAAGHDEDYWWKRADHYRAKLKGTSVQHATEDDETFGFVPGSGPKK